MQIVYVAGPYSARDSWVREQNVRRAEAVSLKLIQIGVAPICVHAMSRFWFGQVSEERAIAWGLELLRPSDAVVLVEGWPNSNGTIAEIREAFKRNIPVYEHVPAFIDGSKLIQGPDSETATPGSSWVQLVARARRATGTDCSVCGWPQYRTPGGDTCVNGHGGTPA